MFDVKSIFTDGSEAETQQNSEIVVANNVVPEFTSKQDYIQQDVQQEVVREVTQVIVKENEEEKEGLEEVKGILGEIRDGNNEIPTSETLATLTRIEESVKNIEAYLGDSSETYTEVQIIRQNNSIIGKVQIALSCVMIGMLFMYLLIGRLR